MTDKPQDDYSSLFHRIGRLRWQAAFLALVLVLAHQWIEHAYLFFLPRWTHFWTQVVFYGLVGPTLAWLALTSLRRQVAETEQAEREVRLSRDQLAEVNRKLEFLIGVERRLAESEDEDELLTAILELPLQVLPALGASLIRYDEEGKPAAADHHGDLPPEEFSRWSAHLAAPDSIQACQSCSAQQASSDIPCPVLADAPKELQAKKVHCLTLNRRERKFGTLNIYLAGERHPTIEERGLLNAMAASMSMALESQLLRAKEMGTLYHLRKVHHLEGLEIQLSEVVTSTVRALELDGGAAWLVEADGTLRPGALIPEKDAPSQDFLSGMATTVRQSSSPMLAADLDLAPQEARGVRSLLVSPLHKDGKWLGSLLFWSNQASAISSRQVRIIESVASQVALLVENHRLYHEVEYRAGLAERARLAREIHDGLAQTLGYLKLRMNQVTRWLEEGAVERSQEAFAEIKAQLNDAYIDARQAIDGLRVDPDRASLQDWLDDIYSEFEELSQIQVEAHTLPEVDLPAEVVSQLLRIIQEALGNVRKHASASRAWIEWQMDNHWIVLRIGDDGCGFDPEQVPGISRHGLRIMKERAELLGADFQLASHPGEGTEITVRLPLKAMDKRHRYG